MSQALQATPPYELVCRADDPAWLEMRRTGIGASEAACLLGTNPWKSIIKLYAEKIGAVEQDDLSNNEAVFWGTKLEAVIRDVFAERTGRQIDKGGVLLRSTRYPWALATLDGWTSDRELGPYWPLEIKTTGAARGGDWVDGPPEHYVVQVHWQMLVTDTPRATIACLVGGQKMVWADVERDDVLIRKLVNHAVEFWARVTDRNPPEPDGTESAKRTLSALYPDDDGATVTLPGELLDVADELEWIKNETKALEARKTAAENRVKAAIGDARRGVLPDGRSWSWSTEERAAYTVPAGKRRVLRMHAAKKR